MIRPYAIDQRLILETGEIQNYLVLHLPSGKETRAPIDLDTTKEILRTTGTSAGETKPPAPPVETPPIKAEDEMTRWQDLPNDVLHPLMKEALRRMGAAAVLPFRMLESLVNQINERFTQEDWDELSKPTKVVEPPTPAPTPPIGAVQWADGRPVIPAALRPGRTLQKDDMGYPVAQDGEVDPGEIVGGADLDEDGVGQL